MKILSIVNQKGGVGKTTTTVNLGAALAKLNRKILLVDLDSQRNLTKTVQAADHHNRSIADLIYSEASRLEYDPSEYVFHNETENMDYIPASPMLASAPSILATSDNSSMVLSLILHHDFYQKYDFVLVDCRPSLDLLSVNALAASDEIMVPVEPEQYAVDGLGDLWASIERTKKSSNPSLKINGILITKADTRRTLLQDARTIFGGFAYELPYAPQAAEKMAAGELLTGLNAATAGVVFEQQISRLADQIEEAEHATTAKDTELIS